MHIALKIERLVPRWPSKKSLDTQSLVEGTQLCTLWKCWEAWCYGGGPRVYYSINGVVQHRRIVSRVTYIRELMSVVRWRICPPCALYYLFCPPLWDLIIRQCPHAPTTSTPWLQLCWLGPFGLANIDRVSFTCQALRHLVQAATGGGPTLLWTRDRFGGRGLWTGYTRGNIYLMGARASRADHQ